MVPTAKQILNTVACIVHGLNRRSRPLVDDHHTRNAMYRPCSKSLNRGRKPCNAPFSNVDAEKTLQLCGNGFSRKLKPAIWTRPHPEKHCIISWWLIHSPPCGPSATNHMNCLVVTLNRRLWNCYCTVQNVFSIIQSTEIVILIDVVGEVCKSLEKPRNVILWLPFWHCTPLSQVIKGLDFWSGVFHHSLDRPLGSRHIFFAMLFSSICIQPCLLKHLFLGSHSQDLEGGLTSIQLLVRLFKIHHISLWEFRAYT